MFSFVFVTLVALQVTAIAAEPQFRGLDPCHPSPCGPNTQCSVNSVGAAVCRCIPGFFPKPDTITGCGHQCIYDSECRLHERCSSGRCVSACVPSPCGTNAECEAHNHRAICKCVRGFSGDPFLHCRQPAPIARFIVSQPAPQAIIVRASDPCAGNPCGSNTNCRNSGDRPVCSCLPGHIGDPYRGCRRGECEANTECPSFQVCENYHCVNPCLKSCGANAQCDVHNHIASCKCPVGYTGDPTNHCRIYDENELCHPSPCGLNTNCRVESGRAICTCQPGFEGNPLSLTGCRHECDSDAGCASHQACVNYKCKNPCEGLCGTQATCDIINHQPICKCPPDYLGDPYTRCYAECTSDAECPGNRVCIGLKCANPCEGACGLNAECRVDRASHKAICSCPRNWLGHPFESCRPPTLDDLCNPNPCGTNAQCTPGHDNLRRDRPVCTCLPGYVGNALVSCRRGECITDSDCGASRTCRNNECRNPCEGACGVNANCEQRNHGAVCSCPIGFRGDPFHQCTADPTRGKRHSNKKELTTTKEEKEA